MASLTAVQSGLLTDAATWGGSTPASGDTLTFGGYTISLASDLRAWATGATLAGSGILLLKAGGALKVGANVPATITVQFGEPTGTGDGPLPAYGDGTLDARAAAELVIAGAFSVLGPVAVYSEERTGTLTTAVVSAPDTTHTVLDGSQDLLVGDAILPMAMSGTTMIEIIVTGWDGATKTAGHSAIAGTAYAQVAGTRWELASCAAHIRRTVSGASAICSRAITGADGSLYVYGVGNSSWHAMASDVRLRRLAANPFAGGSGSLSGGAAGNGNQIFADVLQAVLPGPGVELECDSARLRTWSVNSAISGFYGSVAGGYLAQNPVYANMIDRSKRLVFGGAILPSPAISGTFQTNAVLRLASPDGTVNQWNTSGGVASRVQVIPPGTDLPDGWLLAPVSGRAWYEITATCRRGQSIRLALWYWLGDGAAVAGVEVYADGQIPGVSDPLSSYTVPAGSATLSWLRPPALQHHNDGPNDQLLTIRVWASGGNAYSRVSTEIGGGAA